MQTVKRKNLIVANSILMLFLVVGSTFAWFASNYSNEVDSNQVEVMASNTLEMSLTGNNGDWKSTINLSTDDATKDWFNDVKFTDITGSGNGTFLRPALKLGDNMAVVNPDEAWTKPNPNDQGENGIGDYVTFTLYLRSKDHLKVKLGDGSYVKPVDNVLKGDGVKNVSASSGDKPFSKDIVVGAVRVSAVKSSAANDFFTWIPRPNIFVDSKSTGEFGYEDIKLDQTDISADSYFHFYYSSPSMEGDLTKLEESQTVTGDITAASGNEQTLVELKKNDVNDEYYTGQVKFNIWLEGSDNEARRAFVGGRFKVFINIITEDI